MKTMAVMTKGHKVLVARPDDDLALAFRLMIGAGIRHLPIVEGPHVVGLLTERDVLRRHAEVGSQAAGGERLRDVMTHPPVTVHGHEDATTARRIMLDRGIGCLPVIGAKEELLGIVTRSDLLRADLGASAAPSYAPPDTAGMLMRKAPLTAAADDYFLDALARMEGQGIRHLPVVDGDRRVVGMLSDRDVRTAIGNRRDRSRRGDGLVRLRSLRVSDVMSREPFLLQTDAPFREVAAVFVDREFGAVPVVDSTSRLVGIISYVDVLRNASVL